MKSGNPALNDKVFYNERVRALGPTTALEGARPATTDTMTLDGVVQKSAFLLLLVLAAGWYGWQSVEQNQLEVSPPSWLFIAAIAAMGIAFLTIFKPHIARFTSPVYALLEGLVLGAISALYEVRFEGIVLQAVGLTIGIFVAMLVAYSSGTIRATPAFRRGVIAATMGIFFVYMASFVLRLFGADMPFIHEADAIGILFSLAVVVVASLNLILDFDLIDQGTRSGAPSYMEWYASFSLLVTIVWLYLELLRLLSKLRSR